MDWNPEQTVTVGAVFVGLISAFLLMLRLVGARSDPKLLELLSQQISTQLKREEAITKASDAIVELSKNIADDRRESNKEHQGIIDALVQFKGNNEDEHKAALDAINAIPLQIEPHYKLNQEKIEALEKTIQAKQKQSEGLTEVMVKAVESQGKTNGELLEAVRRVQASQDRIEKVFQLLLESNRRNEALMVQLMEKPQEDLKVLNDDIAIPPPTPDNQPVVMPDPIMNPSKGIIDSPKITSKPETKTDEKDAKNGV
jgi:glycine cleavage system regulatory protein